MYEMKKMCIILYKNYCIDPAENVAVAISRETD